MITVVGIGADGWASLGAQAREAVLDADVLVGGERQLELVAGETRAERRPWPPDLRTLVDELPGLEDAGRTIVVLAAGDPLLHGVGVTILRRVGAERVRVIPSVSSFSLACAWLGWPLADVELVSATGRVAEVVAPALVPGRRIVVLGFGPRTAAEIARVARERGFGASRLVVLEQLGGAAEHVEESTADDWEQREAAALHLVALEVRGGGRPLGRAPGLDDDAYDGDVSGRELRAIALAALVPVPGRLLWDLGSGGGCVAIEWLRAAPGAQAVALARDAGEAAAIETNALRLGVPSLRVVVGEAPDALEQCAERPHAIFVAGALRTYGLLTRCRKALAPGGRLLACAHSVEGETLLSRGYAEQGGRLTRLQIARGEALTDRTGWQPLRPVTLWELRVPWR